MKKQMMLRLICKGRYRVSHDANFMLSIASARREQIISAARYTNEGDKC